MAYKTNIFSSLLVALKDNGEFILNWGEDKLHNEINCNSLHEAEGVARATIVCGYYAYKELKFGNPYLIHICNTRRDKYNWIELN